MKRCETDEDPRLAHAYEQLKICLEALHTLKLEHTWKFTLVNKNGIMRRRETENENVPKRYSRCVKTLTNNDTSFDGGGNKSAKHIAIQMAARFYVSSCVFRCYTCRDVAIGVRLCYVARHAMLH